MNSQENKELTTADFTPVYEIQTVKGDEGIFILLDGQGAVFNIYANLGLSNGERLKSGLDKHPIYKVRSQNCFMFNLNQIVKMVLIENAIVEI